MSETTTGVIAALSVLLFTLGFVMRFRALRNHRAPNSSFPSMSSWVFFWETRDAFSSREGFRMFCLGTELIRLGAIGTIFVFACGTFG